MAKTDAEKLAERVIRAREEGMTWWDIKVKHGMPMTKAKALIRERAPYAVSSSIALDYAWRAFMLKRAGKSIPQIVDELKISKTTVYRAIALGQKAWDRRGEAYKRF